jgi:hypothetical protein
MMRLDWYQTTIAAPPQEVIEGCLELAGEGGFVEELHGMHGYRQRFVVKGLRGEAVGSVLCGGNNDAWPNAWASGQETEAFVRLVRERWPKRHVVTRVDSAEDMQGPKAYDDLRAVVRTVARANRVKCREILPDDDPEEGRTYYGGSPTSSVRLRLYEKGKQERKVAAPDQVASIPRDWVRVETQVRPKGASREVAAQAAPVEVWGFSRWTQEILRQTMDLDVPRVVINPWRESDDERAYRFMLRQYGPLLRRVQEELGSWACVGAQIGDDLSRL